MTDRDSDLKFIDALSRTGGFAYDSPPFRRHLAELFGLERIDLHCLTRVPVRALRSQPRFKELVENAEWSDFAAIEQKQRSRARSDDSRARSNDSTALSGDFIALSCNFTHDTETPELTLGVSIMTLVASLLSFIAALLL